MGPPPLNDGGIAQLGEHLPCKQGVIGSIPIISTKFRLKHFAKVKCFNLILDQKNVTQIRAKPSASGFARKRKNDEVNEVSPKGGSE